MRRLHFAVAVRIVSLQSPGSSFDGNCSMTRLGATLA